MARGPDIIQHQSIPLAATSDQPVDDVPRPPISASNDEGDQSAGVSREITAEELALADAARKGDPATAAIKEPVVKKADTAKPDADGDKPGESADDDGIEFDPTKLPNYAVKEISKVRQATRARVAAFEAQAKKAADDAAAAKADADEARKALEELRAKAPEQPKVNEDPRPTRDMFDDPDLYDEAVVSWADREADRKAAAKVAEKEAVEKKARDETEAATKAEADEKARIAREAELQTINDNWEAAIAAAKAEKYPDWDDVVKTLGDPEGVPLSDVMGAMIIQQPNGTDIGYYLAVNIDEAKRISAIQNPFLQAVEIGKIAQQLSQPARPARRTRPIDPVQTNRTPPENPDPDSEDMDAYFARRSAALSTNRQPFFPPGGIH